MARSKEQGVVYQLKITLKGVRPPIWRRVQVKDCTLARLHDIIQTCMGWDGDHLHGFEAGGEMYGEPDPGGVLEHEDERKAKLSQVVAGGCKKFTYTYDFGDNWDHAILVEKTLEAEPGVRYPCCVAGKRACPPEDCGGPWGYGDFLEAIRNPRHPEHEDRMAWIEGGFDPEAFDLAAVNEELGAGVAPVPPSPRPPSGQAQAARSGGTDGGEVLPGRPDLHGRRSSTGQATENDATMQARIGVESLRPVAVLYEGDIHEFACLLPKLCDARDREAFRNTGSHVRSRPSVNGLAMYFSMVSQVDAERVKQVLVGHGLPLGAAVEHDDAAGEAAPPDPPRRDGTSRRRARRKHPGE